jgi:outer membrane lipoprotein carrier protein
VARVKPYVSSFRLIVGLVAVSAFAGDARLDALLKTVEARYNKANTLQVLFREEYTPVGHARRAESGVLQLRKPGHMRWEYSTPKGKLIVCDGKNMWLYTQAENRAEKLPNLQESSDMRAPLAFLLGKLHFDKEFSNIQGRAEGSDTRITAGPKTDNLPYSAAEFVVTPEGRIREVKATAYDNAVYRFTFDQEKLNPPLDANLFKFQPPKGAEIVEAGG